MVVVRKVQRRYRLYERFETDIWGNNLLEWQNTKIGRLILMYYKEKVEYIRKRRYRYIYRIDEVKPRRKKVRRSWKFLQMKRIKLHYRFVSHRRFRLLDKQARRKLGFSLGHFIINLECRASVMCYRLYFVKNIFEVKKFLFHKNLMVNKKLVNFPNYKIRMYDIIQVRSELLEKIIKIRLLKNLKYSIVYTPVPRFIFMNFSLMYAYIYTYPKIRDLSFPKNLLDYYRTGNRLYEPTMAFDIYRGQDHL